MAIINKVTGGTTVNSTTEAVVIDSGVIRGAEANYSVTEADVTAHEAALTITESQISDLSHSAIQASSDVDHDATTNYVADEHIDWTQASAGTIHATNYSDTQLSDAQVETAYNNQVAAASQGEAEAGTESAIRRFSPLRIAQAIAALATNEVISIALSDETTDLEAGTSKAVFRMPYALTLSEVRASVTTAPTGSTLVVDINESGSTILSTKLSIDASEKTSTTAATPAVISDSSLADDAEITIDIDQIGSSVAGTGLKLYLIGNRA